MSAEWVVTRASRTDRAVHAPRRRRHPDARVVSVVVCVGGGCVYRALLACWDRSRALPPAVVPRECRSRFCRK